MIMNNLGGHKNFIITELSGGLSYWKETHMRGSMMQVVRLWTTEDKPSIVS